MKSEQVKNGYEITSFPVQFSLKGSKLLVILSDEGGIPLYTRSLIVDKRGEVRDNEYLDIESKNEQILLLSGLIEAIMQLKEIVKHIFDCLKEENEQRTLFYVDYAKTPTGMSLVSISTSPEFQQLPENLLNHYSSLQENLENAPYEFLETSFNNVIEGPLNDDTAIYWKILLKIRRDLADFISFILVYDEEGKFLFSTTKSPEEKKELSDPLISSISNYIRQIYVSKSYRDNITLIGSKRLSSSVIWHFKCYNRIFVLFTYIIPAMYDFEILKSELLTFISNNLEKFIEASKTHLKITTLNRELKNTRFILIP